MKKFFKENWFRIIISLVAIIIAGSATYYFMGYLPRKDRETNNQQSLKADQENAQKCAWAGQKYFDENFNEYKNGGFKVLLDGPYFHYNKKMSACLLEYKLMTYDIPINISPGLNKDFRFDGYIINLLSGQTEAFVTYFWKNGKFANDFYQSESERFDKFEMDLMQN